MQTKPLPDEWVKKAKKEMKGREPAKVLVKKSPEGIEVKPLYTPADVAELDIKKEMPGFFPFTRGPMATMYTNRPWTIRQYAGFR